MTDSEEPDAWAMHQMFLGGVVVRDPTRTADLISPMIGTLLSSSSADRRMDYSVKTNNHRETLRSVSPKSMWLKDVVKLKRERDER